MINEIEGIIESNVTEITAVIESDTLEIETEILGSGPRGAQGFSAYELAVQQGFEGTEEEWIASLKGEKGDTYILTDDDRQDIADIVIADLDIKELTWDNIENKPDDIVFDAEYVHTDKNYTNEEKLKLAGISNNAEVNSIESISINEEPIEPDEDKNINISINWNTVANKPNGIVIDEDYVHTSNDFTNESKDKLDSVQSGAEANILNGVNVNGNSLTIVNKKVNVVVPTKTSDLTNDDGFATESFVNSSIGTNTAYYISNNGEPFESFEALKAYSGEVTNNDYAFVVGQDSVGNTTYTRYKYNADNQEWAEEYVLNNSSFTDIQWQSINSGITTSKVAQIETNKTNIANLQQEVSEKMEFYKTIFNDALSRFEDIGGNPLDYQALAEKYFDNKYFLYCEYQDVTYIPSLPPVDDIHHELDILEFTSTWVYDNDIYVSRLIINEANQVKNETETLVKDVKVNNSSVVTNGIANIALADYVKNTEYATSSKGGVVKTNLYTGFGVYDGVPYAYTFTNENYPNLLDTGFIGKKTLENIKEGLVKSVISDDYINNLIDTKINQLSVEGVLF